MAMMYFKSGYLLTVRYSLDNLSCFLVISGDVIERFRDIDKDGENPFQYDGGGRGQHAGQRQRQQFLLLSLVHVHHLLQPNVENPA